MEEKKVMFVDTETSGFISNKIPYNHPAQAWIVQLGWVYGTSEANFAECNLMLRSNGRTMNPKAQEIHGITTAQCDQGLDEIEALSVFNRYVAVADLVVAHNYAFDSKFIFQANQRAGYAQAAEKFLALPYVDTKKAGTALCGLTNVKGHTKPPKLTELYAELFGQELDQEHGALSDALALKYCYYGLIEKGELEL